jgi:putative flippase GtrA
MILLRELVRFVLIGTAGFIVDAGILYLLKETALGNYGGRGVSFSSAVFFTWVLNRCFTFRRYISGMVLWSEFTRYFVSMLGGGSVNIAIYAILISTVDVIAIDFDG